MNQTIADVQKCILSIAEYLDSVCKENGIDYFMMGGTALGAERHKGFIPWDDDFDVFMTYQNYCRFSDVFKQKSSLEYVIQEWRTTENYLEYAKIRKNGTTFIEHGLKNKRIHHGVYIDIMILHKVPKRGLAKWITYIDSKYVTLFGNSQRGWIPKKKYQSVAVKCLKYLPNKLLSRMAYSRIYRYDNLQREYYWCYWITRASYKQGLFPQELFEKPIKKLFENIELLGIKDNKHYLQIRYGDYMCLPSEASRKAMIHAEIFDVERDYSEYLCVQN